VELDLGLAGSLIFSSDMGNSLHHRAPLHVRPVYTGEAKLTGPAQSPLDGW